jgi:hypothetical protein
MLADDNHPIEGGSGNNNGNSADKCFHGYKMPDM